MSNKAVYLLLIVLLISILSGCHATIEGPLPHSMKGYELYSWQEAGQWHFTLITGTNRNKTIDEVITGENGEPESGWVNIHITGVEAIKAVLSRVPKNEWVSWSASGTVTQEEEGVSIWLELPPEDIMNEIKDHADKCGIELMVY